MSINLSDFLGSVVNLETYAPEILGNEYRRCQIMAILDYEDASRYSKVNVTHATVLPNLPLGTSKDYRDLKYLKLKLTNGSTTVLAVEWIILNTIAKVERYRRVRVTLDRMSLEEEDRLRKLLISNDFSVLEIKEV